MRLEVRIPISPTPSFFNRVRLIAQSVREFYPDAIVRAYVGSDCQHVLKPVLPGMHPEIDWVFVEPEAAAAWSNTAHPYIATMMERFKPPFTGTHVLMLDADVLVMDRFDELFKVDAISAMMAHVHPFHPDRWSELARGFGARIHPAIYPVSGWGTMLFPSAPRMSPPYFNTGVLFAPASLLERLYEPYMLALEYTRMQLDSYFFEQIALTLALMKTCLPFNVLPLRYNFPNQREFDGLHPEELNAVKFLHFLRTDTVDRTKDFENLGSMIRLTDRTDLRGSNEVLRKRLQGLTMALVLA